jgi:hypothetical protein
MKGAMQMREETARDIELQETERRTEGAKLVVVDAKGLSLR